MIVKTEGNNLGDLLKYEAPNLYSREEVTLTKGMHLKLGAVVGWLPNKNNIISLFNPSDASNAQIAGGVLITDVDATEKDTKCVIVARDAIVSEAAVIWEAKVTEAQKTKGIESLKAQGILVRKGA